MLEAETWNIETLFSVSGRNSVTEINIEATFMNVRLM